MAQRNQAVPNVVGTCGRRALRQIGQGGWRSRRAGSAAGFAGRTIRARGDGQRRGHAEFVLNRSSQWQSRWNNSAHRRHASPTLAFWSDAKSFRLLPLAQTIGN